MCKDPPPLNPGRSVLVISVVALLLGLGITYFLYSLDQKLQVRERELNDQLARLSTQMVLLGQQLDEGQPAKRRP